VRLQGPGEGFEVGRSFSWSDPPSAASLCRALTVFLQADFAGRDAVLKQARTSSLCAYDKEIRGAHPDDNLGKVNEL
jgi:hypothetical protein